MIRVVLAALLAVGLLAASLPAVEDARVGSTDERVRSELIELRVAVDDLLARDDPVRRGEPGARRVVSVRLPARSWTGAGVERVVLGARSERPRLDRRRLTWRVRGGRRGSVRVPATVRAPEGSPVVLAGAGRHRLRLALVREDGEPAVVVRRSGFKSESGTSAGHVRSPRIRGESRRVPV